MRVFKAALGAAVFIGIFIVLPRLALERVPPEYLMAFQPIQNILTILAALGLALAVFFAAKALTTKGNPVNLIASVGMELAGFCVFLFLVGLGDPMSFGRVEKAIPIGGAPPVTLLLDLRVFVWLLAGVLALKVMVTILGFFQARSKAQTN